MFDICMKTQEFLARHGSKVVFSSFHEEMEERRKAEARKESEGHDKLASLGRQVRKEEVIQRLKEIEEEERTLKELEKLKLEEMEREDSKTAKDDIVRGRDEPTARLKKVSECEEVVEGTEILTFPCRNSSSQQQVMRGQIFSWEEGGCTVFSGLVIGTGQPALIQRWHLNIAGAEFLDELSGRDIFLSTTV